MATLLVKLQYGKDLRRWTVRGEVEEAKPAPPKAASPEPMAGFSFGAPPQSPHAGLNAFGAAPAAPPPAPKSEPRLTIATIESKVREVFDLREPLRLVYVDNEGETVTLEVEDDAEEMMWMAKKHRPFSDTWLPVKIYVNPPERCPPPPPHAVPPPPPPYPPLDSLVQIAGLLEKMAKSFTANPTATASFNVHTDATPQAEAPAQEDAQWVHQGVSCDACGMNPIVGARFKSLTIENFDLCAACEAQPDANMNGLYQRIDAPMSVPTPATDAPLPSGGPSPHPGSFEALRQTARMVETLAANLQAGLRCAPPPFGPPRGPPPHAHHHHPPPHHPHHGGPPPPHYPHHGGPPPPHHPHHGGPPPPHHPHHGGPPPPHHPHHGGPPPPHHPHHGGPPPPHHPHHGGPPHHGVHPPAHHPHAGYAVPTPVEVAEHAALSSTASEADQYEYVDVAKP